MSDFVYSTVRVAEGALQSALRRYLAPVTQNFLEYHGAWGSLAVAWAVHECTPVYENERGISVLIGTPRTRLPGIAEGWPVDARRVALHAQFEEPGRVAWDAMLDGPFAALYVDRQGRGSVLTDLFAWIPVYAGEIGGP